MSELDEGAGTQADVPDDGVPSALVERFKAWAADVLRDEAPPQGVAAELLEALAQESCTEGETSGATDAYALWSAMTALTQEVKLQGRSFKQLSDALEPLRDMRPAVERMMESSEESLEEAKRIAGEALHLPEIAERNAEIRGQRQAQRDLLNVLTDLRDRLSRGLEGAQTHRRAFEERVKPKWFDRLLGRGDALRELTQAAEALEKGYLLCLERLEDALARLGVRELACLGYPFDPRHMVAADIEESSELPEDTVVEVYRTGYSWNGDVFRHAQVKVGRTRPPSPATNEKDDVDDQR